MKTLIIVILFGIFITGCIMPQQLEPTAISDIIEFPNKDKKTLFEKTKKEILKKKNIMENSFYKIRAKYRTENVENDVVEGYEVYSTSIDNEDIIACFFSSEIYGTEEAYKKASEAKEELSSWQYERR